ncbi:general secretion pathway protein GspD [Aestuariibaculum sp. M13]|uniref:type II secretion system protein GspD n=1 Tax=Aestuariibaculum sp. M13 TaxID=2967132 RepID=UPI00215A00E6|nr:general secretion pathway protein GspD [Aestuariibaculum sp. M13]MCR8667500.1 general secretion pathway protein GspD [Aestuariibaculum sp. M13]
MKFYFNLILFLSLNLCFAQGYDNRIASIKNQLDILAVDNNGLSEKVKTEISVSNITLSNLLLGISEIHDINITLSPELNQTSIINNFSNVTVADLLAFLCKEYDLTIDFSGNILAIKKYKAPIEQEKERIIPITYNPGENTISIDAKNDKLYDVFKRIIDESGKNLVFTPGMESNNLTSYIKSMPFDSAMDKLALANQLELEKTKDGFYIFQEYASDNASDNSIRRTKSSNLNFKILDKNRKLLEVNFMDTPISSIIDDIGTALDINIFTATPLEQAGNITFKTKSISFEDLLTKIFEQSSQISTSSEIDIQPQSNNSRTNQIQNFKQSQNATKFTFKKENNIYFFGTEDQLSVREVAIIPLLHRSIEILSDPSAGSNRTVGRTYNTQDRFSNSYNNTNSNNYNSNSISNRNNRENINYNSQNSFSNSNTQVEALLNILPENIKDDLDIKIDQELNSFYVLGTATKVQRFKEFIKKIDKPIPVILIEVMLLEVNRNSTIEAGVSWGIGEESVETQGSIYPKTDLTLGAQTINKVLNGFDGFGHVNLGKVVPNFFATIKAMESNGNIKIRSTPKLSTLNGHRATFSNGQTSYYAVTQRNIYGTDNPQTSEITNYEPIDAELGLTIKPLVSGDGQVTLDIFVIQSSFGLRIAEDAPPDLSSREFSSIIRVQDQDIVVLGGLEEQVKNDSGSGVPFLARVPVIKWLFSQRKREDSKSKLTVLIKPTVIY